MSRFPTANLGAWADLAFFNGGLAQVEARLDGAPVLPPEDRVFAALERTQPEAARVLILGQDPYPTPGFANGLAFSVAPTVRPLPRSLSNIYNELESDLHVIRETGDLSDWADQGVLLLNTALSVAPGQANAHARLGWGALVDEVLARLDERPRVLIAWGKSAQTRTRTMRNPGHLRLEAAHPSPLSARRGFFGSRPFSRANDWLIAQGERPIDWGHATLDSLRRDA